MGRGSVVERVLRVKAYCCACVRAYVRACVRACACVRMLCVSRDSILTAVEVMMMAAAAAAPLSRTPSSLSSLPSPSSLLGPSSLSRGVHVLPFCHSAILLRASCKQDRQPGCGVARGGHENVIDRSVTS